MTPGIMSDRVNTMCFCSQNCTTLKPLNTVVLTVKRHSNIYEFSVSICHSYCCCVQSIEATSAIGSGQVIGEYTGSVMLREEYEHNKPFDVYVHFERFLSSLLLSSSMFVVTHFWSVIKSLILATLMDKLL